MYIRKINDVITTELCYLINEGFVDFLNFVFVIWANVSEPILSTKIILTVPGGSIHSSGIKIVSNP